MAPATRKNTLASAVKSVHKIDKSDDKMLSMLKKLNLKIDKNHADIGAKIDLISAHHRDELLVNIREMESKMDDKFTKCFATNTSQVDHVINIVENNERIAKLNDVVLRGIPSDHKENLVTTFDQISLAIGFEAKCSAVNVIIRLKRGSNETAAPILVKFVSAIMKRDFMAKYYARRDLNLNSIGSNTDGRIYASDNLTKRNFEIQVEAVKLLKDKKISKIHTRSGFVHVKFSGANEFVKILSLNDLILKNRGANESAGE